MRVGVVHNFYRWRGGEDAVFEAECALLARHGFEIFPYTVSSHSIDSPLAKLRALFGSVWNQAQYRELRRFIRTNRLDIVHVHNFFPLISPAVFWAAARERVPAVFTVHNYRLGCVSGQFFRDGAVCTLCAGKPFKHPGILHACFQDSRAASAVVALGLRLHGLIGTWRRKVSAYIALTGFAKQTLEAEGIPPERVVVKPNFVFPQPQLSATHEGHFLFAGRHSREKGIATLLEAWRDVKHPARLIILGEGPLTDELKELAKGDTRIEFRGHVSAQERDQLRRTARAVVFPSVWFEGFPMSIAESLSMGVPVISSRLGAMQSILRDGEDALFFEAGDAAGLARQVNRVCENADLLEKLRAGARRSAAESFQAERNFELLREVYRRALELR